MKRDLFDIIVAAATAGTFVTAIVGLWFAVRTLRRERIQRKKEFLERYFKDYRSVSMGKAIHDLWRLYRDECGGDQDTFVKKYTEICEGDDLGFHIRVRRAVSLFYQQMGFLVEEDPELGEIVYKTWTRGDLEIIPKILLPLELLAGPVVIGDAPRLGARVALSNRQIVICENWSAATRILAELYNGAVRHEG